LGEFVTFYCKTQANLVYDNNDQIKFPNVLVSSPIGPFSKYFYAAWKLIKTKYPKSIYVNYFMLSHKLENIPLENNSVYSLLFGYENNFPLNAVGNRYYNP